MLDLTRVFVAVKYKDIFQIKQERDRLKLQQYPSLKCKVDYGKDITGEAVQQLLHYFNTFAKEKALAKSAIITETVPDDIECFC